VLLGMPLCIDCLLEQLFVMACGNIYDPASNADEGCVTYGEIISQSVSH
jgi:hypothetical protein